jgi:hypothetical protein
MALVVAVDIGWPCLVPPLVQWLWYYRWQPELVCFCGIILYMDVS